MIIVILGICIILIILAVIAENTFMDAELAGFGLFGMGVLGLIISLIVTVILCSSVSKLRVIDDKIAMYQEENTRIETQIATIVDSYKEYETDTFTGLTSESTMILATIYPELKSNELVQSQMDIYVNNNERIKELREEKINGSVTRWWLYFGK